MFEYVVMAVLLSLVIIHTIFDRMYSRRLRQLDADITDMESEPIGDVRDAITDRFRMSAQAKVDRTNNRHVLAINIICIAGLAILLVLHHIDAIQPMGWMSLLLLSLPAFMLFYLIRDVYHYPVRGRF